MEPGQACAMQCVRLWWHAECSGAQCTHSARKHGGRLRAGPSFLAKVDLLIGRWPGWEGGTHLCSRCSPCCPSSDQLPSQWLIAILWNDDGLRQGRSYYVVVQRRSRASRASGAGVDFAEPWPKLERVGGLDSGGASKLQRMKRRAPPPGILRSSPCFR